MGSDDILILFVLTIAFMEDFRYQKISFHIPRNNQNLLRSIKDNPSHQQSVSKYTCFLGNIICQDKIVLNYRICIVKEELKKRFPVLWRTIESTVIFNS